MGARKQPYYRVVVIEKERARNGRPVEVVGTYNPRTKPVSIDLKRERIDYWVSKGAKLSDRVGKIVCQAGRRLPLRLLNPVSLSSIRDSTILKTFECARGSS